MEIKGLRPVESVIDVRCDVCQQSCSKPIAANDNSFEYGVLKADWGYGSSNDLACEECHLCEACFAKVKNFIFSLHGTVRQWSHG